MVSIGAIKRELLRSFFLLFSRCSFQFCFCCGVVMHEKLIKARPTVAPRSRAVFFVRSVDPEIQKTHQPEHDGYDANNTINSSFTWTNGDRLLVIFFFFCFIFCIEPNMLYRNSHRHSTHCDYRLSECTT